MRFVLRLGTREVLVCTRDRFKRFDSTDEAATFLTRYALEMGNFRSLRAALATSPGYSTLLKLNQPQLILKVAEMLVDGRLNLLPDADGMPPWSWTFPMTPTAPWEDASADIGPNALAGEDEEIEETENERVDVKPEPVIPPEFPRLAKEEAEALAFEAKKYGIEVDLLRHVDTDYPPDSELAKEFNRLASTQGQALEEAVNGNEPLLDKLSAADNSVPAHTQLGEQFGDVSKEQGKQVKTLSEKIGDFLRAILSGAGPDDPRISELAEALKDAHEGQGKNVQGLTETVNQLLAMLAPDEPKPITRPESGVSDSLRNLHGEHGDKIVGAANDLHGTLDDAIQMPPLPTTPGWVRFQIVDDETGEPLKGYTLVVRGEDGAEIELEDGGAGMIETQDLPEGPVGLLRIIDDEAYEVVEVVAEEA
ncbi:MAG: hypothetical protein KC583_10610 [Myxococcales bacterium]|nr:hypothetical protein [Myxococcales bacterium]